MYEVVVTYRSDFSEDAMGRYENEQEAQDAAHRLALENHDKIVRALVRVVREVKTQN